MEATEVAPQTPLMASLGLAEAASSVWKPTTASLLLLPHIKALSVDNMAALPQELLVSLLDEYHTVGIIDKLEETKQDARSYKKRLEKVREETNKAIARQYRKASIRVHPDRHGAEHEEEFELLLLAYDALREPEKRNDYVTKMLYSIKAVGGPPQPSVIEGFHNQWQDDQDAASEQDTAHARYKRSQQAQKQQQQQQQQTYRIEADLLQRAPGRLLIQKVEHRIVHAGIQITHFDVFSECCTSIVVEAFPAGDDSNKTKLLKLCQNNLKTAFNEAANKTLHVRLTLPSYGYWEMQWKAHYHMDGTDHMTSATSPRMVDACHPATSKALKEKPALLLSARKQAGALKSAVRHLLSQQDMSRDEMESTRWNLHALLSKGRSIARHLNTTLDVLGIQNASCGELESLFSVLDEAVLAKVNLDDTIEAHQKKDSLKGFKQSIAALIERGEAAEWIASVTKEELVNHGGEANRLFQLLIEGKKARSLLVDSVCLSNAAKRADLFSEKQCGALLERSSEVEALAIAETERLIKEEEEHKAVEKERQEMEEQANLAFPRGTVVQLIGLKDHKELNGSQGNFMGIAQGNRYIIKLPGSKEVALKRENFESLQEAFKRTEPSSLPEPTHSSTTANYKKPCAIIHIQKIDVSRFIGRQGANIKQIQADIQGIRRIHVNQQNVGDKKFVPVRIEGRPESVQKAVSYIESNFTLLSSLADEHVSASPKHLPQSAVSKQRPVPAPVPPVESLKKATAKPRPKTPASSVPREKSKKHYSAGPQTKTAHQRVPMSEHSVAQEIPESKHPVVVHEKASKKAISKLDLIDFLSQHKDCFKYPHEKLYAWLCSEDVASLDDLAEAVEDEDFRSEMQANGLKGFKKLAFRRAVLAAVAESGIAADEGGVPEDENGLPEVEDGISVAENGLPAETDAAKVAVLGKTEAPDGLYCPISSVLMINDPVVASDGFTYERCAIESWFRRHSDSKEIRSPMTNAILPHLELQQNTAIRVMAMDHANSIKDNL